MLFRRLWDRFFTQLSILSIILLTLALVIILGPMIAKGLTAVFFKGTVEFRKMQFARYDRGDAKEILKETKETDKYRVLVYEMLNEFRKGIDTSHLKDEARDIYRDYGEQLRYRNIKDEEYTELRSFTRDLRKKLESAFESTDKEQVYEDLNYVLKYEDDKRFEGTIAEGLFELARDYKETIEQIDLSKRDQYLADYEKVEESITELFGPAPEESLPPLVQNQYGATRADMMERSLDKLLYAEKWKPQGPGKPLKKVKVSREEVFAGTSLEPLFSYVKNNLDKMLHPEFTFYWQYFIDDSTPGYYFGGVGPEIIGTLLLTLLALLFAIPLGIISAAYLVECAGDNFMIKVIRISVNTLAGVPSIVFGLFGLAFFVLFLLPTIGKESEACILTASLTLAILVLPVIIRASEEAIKSVPKDYKEASLALGAGKFRTFITVTLPAALPGILTGIILSLGRAAGETAPILFTGAVALGPIPESVFSPTRALSYGSYNIAVGDRLSMLVPHKQYGMIMTLVVLVLIMNITAILLRSHVSKKLRGH